VDFHRGTLFFPLPDGSALLYNLVGKSNPPLAAQTIDVNMRAKQIFT
jgi:hydrocephalus-inducing protein